MNALVNVYRPALRLSSICRGLSDRVDHLVIVNLAGLLKPNSRAPAYMLVAHERYPRIPMLVPVGTDGEMVLCGRSGNYAGCRAQPGWFEAVENITGGFGDLVEIYDEGFMGGEA